MSLESIYRVISNARKSAADQNGGTADEKAALEVLGGLSALLETRIQLHKHATPATHAAEAQAAVKTPSPAGASAPAAPTPTAAGFKKQRTPPTDVGDPYDLK
jgi:hypothetical protein